MEAAAENVSDKPGDTESFILTRNRSTKYTILGLDLWRARESLNVLETCCGTFNVELRLYKDLKNIQRQSTQYQGQIYGSPKKVLPYRRLLLRR